MYVTRLIKLFQTNLPEVENIEAEPTDDTEHLSMVSSDL